VPPAPPVKVCRACGAPAERGQEYCLECGNRILPARRPPVVAAWVVPALVALVVATAGAAAAIASTHDHKDNRTRTFVALSPLQPAPPPKPHHTVKPPSKASASKLIAWPAGNGYTIVLATIPLASGANAAKAKAAFALRKGLQRVGVLVSSSYPSLQPGYYIVFSGVYPSLEEAQSDLDAAKATFPGAYARPIAR
jgi:septal ring-binding cell division protein DamX